MSVLYTELTSNRANLFTEDIIDPTIDLGSTEVLSLYGFLFHRKLRVLICQSCRTCFTPRDAVGHARKSHAVKLNYNDDFQDDCQTLSIHPTTDVPVPEPRGPPVPMLDVFDGFSCSADPLQCNYCCRSESVIQRHVRETHMSDLVATSHGYRSNAKVQAYFQSIGTKYFEVLPALNGVKEDHVLSIVLRRFIPCLPEPEPSSPDTERERTPFMKLMNWDFIMKSIRLDKDARLLLKDLRSPPTKEDVFYQRLNEGVLGYIWQGMEVVSTTQQSLTVRKIIMHGSHILPSE